MIKIPYGESDFKGMMENNYFYQDRTSYIEELEKWKSKYPVFLRPRRFGKSLFVSTLQHYYGLEHKEAFPKLFGNLYIGRNLMPSANSYMVLRLEFSRIDTATHESTYRGFLSNVIEGVGMFLGAYRQFFSEEDKRIILSQTSPEDIIKSLCTIVKTNQVPHKIYVLIDEYDHFANELLSFDLKRFKKEISRNGFLRKFYETLKKAANEGIIDRIFITGVSPITLDSLTSGFNISSNITTNPIFHDMMGFRHQEVEAILHESQILEDKIPEMMSNLTEWYDGYQFTDEATAPLFNPDMVLYFLQQYSIKNEYPKKMLDTNVISDYRKIRNIFKIGNEEDTRFELLEKLVQTGNIDFPLTQLYNLEDEFTEDDFLSLLFYMGMLSFKEVVDIGWRCEIPNYVIKKLYFEYFANAFIAKSKYAKSTRKIGQAVSNLISQANPEPFLKVVEDILKAHHSNRDEMVYGEKHLQTLMVGLLAPYDSIFIHSEYESGRGYPDIFLERLIPVVKYEVVLELKYVKKTTTDKVTKVVTHTTKEQLDKIIAEAEAQLNGYMTSKRFDRPDIRGFYAVYFGGEVYKWGEYGQDMMPSASSSGTHD
ncbi:MAG: AAA family ATPase [Saprospiraceae bacterium]|nr:AAA family ATPase [Saprospiraceae bacterium]